MIRRVGRALLILAILTFVAGVATCFFGSEHEIAKIPPEQRAQMTDTDWIGTEWMLRGMFIEACAVAIFVIAVALRAWERSRAGVPSQDGSG